MEMVSKIRTSPYNLEDGLRETIKGTGNAK